MKAKHVALATTLCLLIGSNAAHASWLSNPLIYTSPGIGTFFYGLFFGH